MGKVLDGIVLPEGLIWEDEFDWTPISQETAVSLTGSLIVQEAAVLAGRPITLVSRNDSCWISRSNLRALVAIAQTADKVMALAIDGTTYSVLWQRGSQAPIEARQAMAFDSPDDDTVYVLQALRFLVIEQ